MTTEPEKIKLLRVPLKLKSRDMLIGTISKLEQVEDILVIVNDDEGIWILTEDGSSHERLNWMLDRAKMLIHGVTDNE